MDVANGDGMRVSVFLQGCPHHCPGCFSEDTWSPEGGELLTKSIKNDIYKAVQKDEIDGVTILGGEPLAPYNLEATKEIAREVSVKLGKTVWIYTGYVLEDLDDNQRTVLSYVDVLIDGRFDKDKKTETGSIYGSSNQRKWTKSEMLQKLNN